MLQKKAVIEAGLFITHIEQRGQYNTSSPLISQILVMIPESGCQPDELVKKPG
ncbi:MAG: hypothetical protein ACYC9J_06145 [Sulfuricaulis sp.]